VVGGSLAEVLDDRVGERDRTVLVRLEWALAPLRTRTRLSIMSLSKVIRSGVSRSVTNPCIWSNLSVDESACVRVHTRS
jgi:hypothetical protein